VLWQDEDATRVFAQDLATRTCIADAFIELQGDLGAGKTSLARHLLRALGVEGRIKSPTYAVLEPYSLCANGNHPALDIWHFDFYRFNDPREWEDAGFRELFAAPGLKLAEWADKARAVLPVADLVIHLEAVEDDSRRVTLTAHTPNGLELLA
jgi:tRNA threonylcarbamoyladenosine biosynthesis protein TsaE